MVLSLNDYLTLLQDGSELVLKEVGPGENIASLLSVMDVLTVSIRYICCLKYVYMKLWLMINTHVCVGREKLFIYLLGDIPVFSPLKNRYL